MNTHTGPNRFQPRRGEKRPSVEIVDLATLLARGFLRLAERSHTGAVSGATVANDRLDVSALPRPDVSDRRTARRPS
jgi:hypothetical protein